MLLHYRNTAAVHSKNINSGIQYKTYHDQSTVPEVIIYREFCIQTYLTGIPVNYLGKEIPRSMRKICFGKKDDDIYIYI